MREFAPKENFPYLFQQPTNANTSMIWGWTAYPTPHSILRFGLSWEFMYFVHFVEIAVSLYCCFPAVSRG